MYGFDEEAAHTFMCRTLLAYLMQFDKTDSLSRENITDFPLAVYAAKFWTHHAEAIQPDTEGVQTAIMGLLHARNAEYLNCIRIYDPDASWRTPLDNLDIVPAPPLYYVSLGGMEKIAQMLIQRHANVNAKGASFGIDVGVVLEEEPHNSFMSTLRGSLEGVAIYSSFGIHVGVVLDEHLCYLLHST